MNPHESTSLKSVTLSKAMTRSLIKRSKIRSDNTRVASQRGNALLYVLLFAAAWFLFFSLRSCVMEAKEKRDHPSHSQSGDEEESE